MPLNPMYASGVMAHTKDKVVPLPYPVGEMTPPSTGPPCSGPPPPVFGQLTKAEMLAIVKEQALSKQKKKDSPARTFQEQIKFYATFSFSLIAISGFSVLMFLVPFIVDPALATLTADFVEKPVECRVTFSKAILGLSNCSWSSCREGCTRDIFSCHHILVEYTYLQEDYRIMKLLREKQGLLDPSPTKHSAVLFVNVKGCGYPPSVNCTTWISQFGVVDSTFPCYYARTNQSVAITHLDTKSDMRDLVMSTCIPLAACAISGLALCMMHTKCVQTMCRPLSRSHSKYKSVRIAAGPDHDDDQEPDLFSQQYPEKSYTNKNPKKSILTSSSRSERANMTSNGAGEKTKLRKRLSFHNAPSSFKRKADLLELPALSKKVKTESDDDIYSSTENLLELETIPEMFTNNNSS